MRTVSKDFTFQSFVPHDYVKKTIATKSRIRPLWLRHARVTSSGDQLCCREQVHACRGMIRQPGSSPPGEEPAADTKSCQRVKMNAREEDSAAYELAG